MTPAELHADSIVIDGLIIAKWNRELFEDMRKGGLTAANCTVSVWEGFQATVNNIVASNKLIAENGDLVIPVRTTADIRKAKEQGKTGILYGFQNAHAFEDQIGYVEVFKQLGVGIVQLCYNTQNLVGTGCYERDGGLSGFGHEIVAEMNRVGIMCDLSHVGSKTSEEVILASKKPVCYSHCLPSGLKEHPRNKSDAELKFIADHGGFVGVTGIAGASSQVGSSGRRIGVPTCLAVTGAPTLAYVTDAVHVPDARAGPDVPTLAYGAIVTAPHPVGAALGRDRLRRRRVGVGRGPGRRRRRGTSPCCAAAAGGRGYGRRSSRRS